MYARILIIPMNVCKILTYLCKMYAYIHCILVYTFLLSLVYALYIKLKFILIIPCKLIIHDGFEHIHVLSTSINLFLINSHHFNNHKFTISDDFRKLLLYAYTYGIWLCHSPFMNLCFGIVLLDCLLIISYIRSRSRKYLKS